MESDRKLLFKHVIEYFAIAAIAVQAVFAAFWLFKNIGVLQWNYEAYTYIQAAETLKVDDSMGILYALIVRVLGHGVVLRVFQILAVTAAVFFFSLTAFNKKTAVLFALLAVTSPLLLQAETAVSPGALVVACLFAAIASALRMSSSRNWVWALFAASVFAGFLSPDYAWLIFAVSLIFFIVRLIGKKKAEVLLILAFVITVSVNYAVADYYAYGRVHRTPAFLTMQRVVWPNMNEYATELQRFEENVNSVPSGMGYAYVMSESDKVAENIAMEMAYKFEHTVDIAHAQDSYRYLTALALAKGPGYWVKGVIRDEVLYLFSPAAATVVYLKQKTDTSVPCGLDYLFSESPKVFKIYFLFSSTVMFLFTLMYIVKFMGERVIGQKAPGIGLAFALFGIIVLLSLYATFVCVRGYDYRNVLFMVAAWPAAAVALTERRKA